MKKIKILVLGSTGMAGHVIYRILSTRVDYEVTNVSFRKKLNESSIILDITDKYLLFKTIKRIKPEIVINCIGILKKGAKESPENAIFVNAYFPHLLSRLTAESKTKLIHISTDCVFSGSKGNYSPKHPKDAQDIYGMSKALGEIINQNDLTIRTSIIGPEIKTEGEGLLHWFLNQQGEIRGYTNSYWSGVTTLQLAKLIEHSIDNNFIGLIQYSNGIKISKYQLLKIFQETWHKYNIEIIPENGKKVDKSLIPSYPQSILPVPSYIIMCKELAEYMNNNSQFYKHYLLTGSNR